MRAHRAAPPTVQEGGVFGCAGLGGRRGDGAGGGHRGRPGRGCRPGRRNRGVVLASEGLAGQVADLLSKSNGIVNCGEPPRKRSSRPGSAGSGCEFTAAPRWAGRGPFGGRLRSLLMTAWWPSEGLPAPISWCRESRGRLVGDALGHLGATGDASFEDLVHLSADLGRPGQTGSDRLEWQARLVLVPRACRGILPVSHRGGPGRTAGSAGPEEVLDGVGPDAG